MKIRPVGAEGLRADGQTDIHDGANSRFSQCYGSALKLYARRWTGFNRLSSWISKDSQESQNIPHKI